MKQIKYFIIIALLGTLFYACSETESDKELIQPELSIEDNQLTNRDLDISLLGTSCDKCGCGELRDQLIVEITNGEISLGDAITEFNDCLNLPIVCTPGFTYDGCNCYSGVHIPEGYSGFVYGNSFYVVPNANGGCPPGYTFDGANCQLLGLSFPAHRGWEGFIYNGAFYVSAQCCPDC